MKALAPGELEFVQVMTIRCQTHGYPDLTVDEQLQELRSNGTLHVLGDRHDFEYAAALIDRHGPQSQQ